MGGIIPRQVDLGCIRKVDEYESGGSFPPASASARVPVLTSSVTGCDQDMQDKGSFSSPSCFWSKCLS